MCCSAALNREENHRRHRLSTGRFGEIRPFFSFSFSFSQFFSAILFVARAAVFRLSKCASAPNRLAFFCFFSGIIVTNTALMSDAFYRCKISMGDLGILFSLLIVMNY